MPRARRSGWRRNPSWRRRAGSGEAAAYDARVASGCVALGGLYRARTSALTARVADAVFAPFARRRRPVPPRRRRKNYPVPRIFITGSTDGLGRAAAGVLISEGHEIVLHARSRERAAALSGLAADAAGVVIGDLSSAAETRELADQVNQIGRMDAVIHNAGPRDPAFQDQLMDRLAALTGVALF
jgi:hypothetical protein